MILFSVGSSRRNVVFIVGHASSFGVDTVHFIVAGGFHSLRPRLLGRLFRARLLASLFRGLFGGGRLVVVDGIDFGHRHRFAGIVAVGGTNESVGVAFVLAVGTPQNAKHDRDHKEAPLPIGVKQPRRTPIVVLVTTVRNSPVCEFKAEPLHLQRHNVDQDGDTECDNHGDTNHLVHEYLVGIVFGLGLAEGEEEFGKDLVSKEDN